MKHTLLALSLLTLMACSDNKAADLTDKQQQLYVTQPSVSEPCGRGCYGSETLPPTPTTEESSEGYSTGEMVVAGVAGAAVGALAANTLSSKPSREVEKCDWDDHPNEPECRGTAKYYKWKREQDAKKKQASIAKQRKPVYYKTKRKPQ